MERREFLRRAAAAAGAAAVGGGLHDALAAGEKVERRNERPPMKYVRLGRTNLMVSQITYGGQHANQQRISVLAKLFDSGVNLFDTSHVYGGGRSEQAFGQFFGQQGRRDKMFICTKVDLRRQLKKNKGVYNRAMQLADAALRRMRTDHVDILMLHGCASLLDWILNEEWLRAAEDLREQGKTRFIGFSEHAKPAETLTKAAKSGRYDVAMVAHSVARAAGGGGKAMTDALAAAGKADMGILVIKAAQRADQMVKKANDPRVKQAGHSAHQLCYRYVLSVPGVHSVVCGMTSHTHVEQDLAVPSIQFAARDGEHLRGLAAVSGACGFCGACLDACPNGIAVQDILRFDAYRVSGHSEYARAEYAALDPSQRATACRDCGSCERACPNHVDIRRQLAQVHSRLA